MKILLIGAGGYGSHYVKYFLSDEKKKELLAGVVEPYFDTCPNRDVLLEAKIPVFSDAEEFFKENSADLAIIATPIFLHCEQSISCVRHGANVLCEKPVCPTVEEAEKMMAAEKETGKFIAIGYQWSFSEAIRALKEDILAGKLGKALSMKTLILWPRKKVYFARGCGWAGQISRNGSLVLDSIVSNACAHYLHNMLFLLGEKIDESAEASVLSARLRRAYPIENFDSCTLSLKAGNVPLYFAASHCSDKKRNPVFSYEFEKGTVVYDGDGDKCVKVLFADGSVKDYGSPEVGENPVVYKLESVIEAVEKGEKPICTVKTALPHVAVVEALYRGEQVRFFPDSLVEETEEKFFVHGLTEEMLSSYENTSMLSEKF